MEEEVQKLPENSTNLNDRAKIGFEMFKLHADQRLKFIQFFTPFYAATFAAAAYLSSISTILGSAAFLVLLGFVALFWALENRTKELIKKSELVMCLDSDYRYIIHLFDQKTYPSYARCIKIFYLMNMVFSGMIATVLFFSSFNSAN